MKLVLQALVSIAVVSMSRAAVVPEPPKSSTDGAVEDPTTPEAPSKGFLRFDDNEVDLSQLSSSDPVGVTEQNSGENPKEAVRSL